MLVLDAQGRPPFKIVVTKESQRDVVSASVLDMLAVGVPVLLDCSSMYDDQNWLKALQSDQSFLQGIPQDSPFDSGEFLFEDRFSDYYEVRRPVNRPVCGWLRR